MTLIGVIAVSVTAVTSARSGPGAGCISAPQRSREYGHGAGAYLLIAVLLVVIGARGRRRANTQYAGAKAGAVAGFVIATLIMATFVVIDNLFFGTISQQHDKVVAFANSDSSSMRLFVNVSLLQGSAVLIPTLTIVGGVLGFLGGQLTHPVRSPLA